MESQTGWIDTRGWISQEFDALLGQLRTGRHNALWRSARLVPTYREFSDSSRIIARLDPEHGSLAIEQLSQQPLLEGLRFLTGCRDLIVAFLGIDPTGMQLRYIGDADSVRSVIADNHSSIPVAFCKQIRHQIRQKLHWRTEDRLERTFAAVVQLLERLTDRSDVVFVAAWRLGGDSPARIAHSMGLRRGIAQECLVEFERRVLPDRKEVHSVS